MAIRSKRDIDNTRKLISNLKKIKQTIFLVGERYRGETIEQWSKGKNVGGDILDPLTSAYKKFKVSKGKSGLPDLEGPSVRGHSGGQLIKSLQTKLIPKGVSVSINVKYGEFVAERNENKGLWGMTDKFRKDTLRFIKKRLSPA